MTSIDICSNGRNAWHPVLQKVNKAVVFLDSPAAESLHWNGGAVSLLNNGAINIKEFSSFESGNSNEPKAVFVIGGPLKGHNSAVMQDILHASEFQYVIVFSGLNPAMHTLVQFGGMEDEQKAFHMFEELLLEWMGNMNYTAEMYSAPLICAPISPHLFILPEHSKFFPLLPNDIQSLQNYKKKQDTSEGGALVDYTDLPQEMQLQYKLLVCSINSVLEQWDVSEDIFCIGATSNVIASELASLPWAKGRRRNGKNKASLLLVDRSLDVSSTCGHHTDTLIDKMIDTLDRLDSHTVDVKVDMVSLCSAPSTAKKVIAPGCLAHSSNQNASSLLQSLLVMKHKEALMEINRQVVEAASSCGLKVNLAGRSARITAEQISSTLQLFKGKTDFIRKHSGLIQIAQAAVETLENPSVGRYDSLLGIEKGIVQGLGDSSSGHLLTQLTETVTMQHEKNYTLQDVFVVLVFVYSLADEGELDDPEKERTLMTALREVIMNTSSNELQPFLHELMGEDMSQENVSKVLNTLFRKLKALSETREYLKQFRSIYHKGDDMSPSALKPLLKQIVETIFDPAKPELPDINYKSTGFRNLLKSGFGLFRNVSKPRPNDQPIVIVFVIGGITSTEVKQIKDAAAKSNAQVIVGSTSLTKPSDILHRLLVQDNTQPPSTVL